MNPFDDCKNGFTKSDMSLIDTHVVDSRIQKQQQMSNSKYVNFQLKTGGFLCRFSKNLHALTI